MNPVVQAVNKEVVFSDGDILLDVENAVGHVPWHVYCLSRALDELSHSGPIPGPSNSTVETKVST